MMPQPVTTRARPWYARWWLWVIVGVVVLGFPVACTAVVGAVVVGAALSSASTPVAAPVESAEPVESVEAERSVEPSAAPVPDSSAPSDPVEPAPAPLADTVWANVQAAGVSTGSPLFAVSQVEDVSPGTIRVYVQDDLTDAGRTEVAQHVFQLGAWDLTELEAVVVQDTSGVDSNHYRRDFPHLPQ